MLCLTVWNDSAAEIIASLESAEDEEENEPEPQVFLKTVCKIEAVFFISLLFFVLFGFTMLFHLRTINKQHAPTTITITIFVKN